MARPLRIEYPGGIYHVTSRGNACQDIFVDACDRTKFLKTVAQTVDRFNWLCHGYCLMTNHYHLLIETVDASLSRGMRHLNGVYTQAFNRRHRSSGHLLQGRYKAIVVEKDSHLLELARYVVLNPVRARIVRSCKDWRWSSYRATAGLIRPEPFLTTDWILSQFGVSRQKAQRAYRRFVSAGRGAEVWDRVRGQIYFGSESFIEQHAPGAGKTLREVPREQRFVNRPSLEEVFASESQDRAVLAAYREHGYKLKEIAAFLGVHYSTASRRLKRQEVMDE